MSSSTTEGPVAVESTSSGGTSSNSAVTAMDSLVTNIVESIKVVISSTTTSATTTATSTSTTDSISSSSTAASNPYSISGDPSEEGATTTKPPGMMNVSELNLSLQHFGTVDYLVFVLMLLICAVIGFYFGFIEKKKKKRNVEVRRGSEALDYLVGGRKMKVFPVALSLVASFVSGISLLGTSTEIYVYGTQYAFILITLAISGVISWYVFLPVFCNLQLTSTYEYFEMRFDKGIRLFGSVLFTVGTIFWLPIVIYVPALAFNQVTGINIHVVTPAVCIVCIFYTCVGGLKAVIWTDVIQTIIMFGAIMVIVIKGTINVGGLDVVWQRNLDSGRIEAPEMTWDPTVRVSMFSVFFGTTLYYLQLTGGNQVITQRYLSLPNLKAVKNALILFVIGMTILHSVCFYNGLLIFARYYDCDPLTTKLAKAKDQLVPLMALEILSAFPGMPGLFIAGVFSAALSSLSTGLNSLAAVFLEDYIKPFRETPLTERQTAVVMRLSVLLVGVLCVALVFVVEHMGAVLQLSMTLNSITCGPLFGLFMMGLTLPWINGKSALAGSIISFIIMTWISAKAQLAIANGELVYPEKPVSTEGCSYDFKPLTTAANSTLINEGLNISKPFSHYIYHMSFMFYVPVGATITIVGACLASLKYGFNDPSKMNINIFPPFVQRFIKPVDYDSVKTDEQTVIFGLEGGLKAVVWTDVIQTVIMFGAILVISIKGTIDVGGLGVVWDRNYESGRIELPVMTWDPTVRISMLSMFVGTTLFYTHVFVGSQVIVQRYLSLPNLKAVKKALILFVIGIITVTSVCMYNGLLIYAKFHDCDPVTTKLIKAKDQLMSLFAMDVLSIYPGAPGLFVAGVFSAALSSLSTGLNSLTAVLLEDYIKPFKKTPLTEFQTALVMRISVVLFGILCVGLVFIVERMGAVVELSLTLGSITCGPLFGLFLMGVLLPWINGKSALAGSILSFGTMSWICIKAQLARADGELFFAEKPVSTAGCTYSFDVLTSSINTTISEEGSKTFSQYIYHMSFMFYAIVGSILTIVFAHCASLIYGRNDPSKMNVELFSPFVRRFIKPEEYESVQPEEKCCEKLSL